MAMVMAIVLMVVIMMMTTVVMTVLSGSPPSEAGRNPLSRLWFTSIGGRTQPSFKFVAHLHRRQDATLVHVCGSPLSKAGRNPLPCLWLTSGPGPEVRQIVMAMVMAIELMVVMMMMMTTTVGLVDVLRAQ